MMASACGAAYYSTATATYMAQPSPGDLTAKVFELSPGSKGTWSETILHSFPSFEYDGAGLTSTLVWDAVGNLYGTTEGGGTHHSGTAFELAQASWAETILYNFCADSGCSDGGSPSANMIMDQTGNLLRNCRGGL